MADDQEVFQDRNEPLGRQQSARKTTTGAKVDTDLATAAHQDVTGLAAKVGGQAASTPDPEEPRASQYNSIGAFAEARRRWREGKGGELKAKPTIAPAEK